MNRIFIVDDDDSILKLYRNFLEFKGFNVIDHAKNGIEAVDKYLRFKIKPDLIIMDYHMPFKNGIEATKEILKINRKMKIILISGDCSIKNEALAAGAMSFKKKPFSLQELYSSLSTLMSYESNPTSSKMHAC
ncbi:MAG: response regulator [Candidatus Hermodarchaeota archaeon]